MKRIKLSEERKEKQREYARQWAKRNKEKVKERKMRMERTQIGVNDSFQIPELKFHPQSGLMSFAGSEVNNVGVEEVLDKINDTINTVFFDGDTFSSSEVKRKILNSGIDEYWLQILSRTGVLIIIPKLF